MAWFSIDGLYCGSQMTTTLADWMFKPVPPDWICATSIEPFGAASNSSMVCWRFAGATEPLMVPTHFAPRASTMHLAVSRKNVKTRTLRPSSSASETISMRRLALEESTRDSTFQETRRAAMKFLLRTALS